MVYLNNGDGTYRNVTDRHVILDRNGMGSALGDYDGDGDLDWFVTSIWSQPDAAGDQHFELGNRLYNNQDGVFLDVTDCRWRTRRGLGLGSVLCRLRQRHRSRHLPYQRLDRALRARPLRYGRQPAVRGRR